MNVLVACEESQRVTIEFRRKGHNAFSCDVIDCSGGHPEWHIKQDVLPLLNGDCTFETADGQMHTMGGQWDMIIAFPPCTHLAASGAKHFSKKRADGRQREAVEFFCKFLKAKCDKVAIENPIGIISGEYVKEYFPILAEKHGLPKKPNQIFQPWMFGDKYAKSTCLWLKGLNPLVPAFTEQPELEWFTYTNRFGKPARQPKWYVDALRLPPTERAKARSKTFPNVAKAMAEQWGGTTNENNRPIYQEPC